MSEDLISTADLLRLFALEADAERQAAGPDAADPCPWVGTTSAWVSKMTARPLHPLPVAVPGAPGRSSLFVPADVRCWFAEEFERQSPQDLINSPETGILLPYSVLAREIGTHPNTLAKRLADYAVQPARQVGGKSYYRLADMLAALTAAAKAEDPDSLPPSDRDAHWRAEARKDEVMTKRRELVTTADAIATLSSLAAILRDACDLIPDALESRCQLSATALDLVTQTLDATRLEISARVQALRASLLRPEQEPPMDADLTRTP
jgi:hypothetical protein